MIGQAVEIFSFLVLKLVELILCELKKLLKGHFGDVGAAGGIHVGLLFVYNI